MRTTLAEAETQFLTDLSERIRLAGDADELLRAVAQAIGAYLQVTRCLFIEIDLEHDRAVVLCEYSQGAPPVTVEYKISDYSPITRLDMEAGRPVINYDSQADPRTAAVYEATYQPQGERAYMAVPLMREGQWTGVLWVSTDQPRQWQQQEITLLETAAERTWLAVEKLRLEKGLEREQELLQAIFDKIPVMLIIYRPDIQVLQLNPEFEQVTGWSSEEARQVDLMAQVYPDPAYREEVRHFMDELLPGWKDIVMLTRAGQMIQTMWSNVRLSDETRIGIGLDITARKQMEEALRQNEQQLRTLLELLPVGVWLTDNQGSIVLDNPASQRIWGIRHNGQEHYGQYKGWWADSGQPLKSEDWSLPRVLATGEPILGELIDIETFEGQRKTIINSVVPIKTKAGQLVGAVVVNEDVTHLRRVEQALRQSEERYRLAAEAVQALIFDWDLASDTFNRSQGLEKLLGFWPEEVEAVESWWLNRVHPDDLPTLSAQVERALAGDASHYQLEYRLLHRDNTYRAVWDFGRIVRDETGQAVRVVGSVMDITERKEAEAVLARYRLLSAQARDIILFIRQDGQIIEANRAAVAAYGYDRDTLLSLNIKDLRDPATTSLVSRQLIQADAGGVQFETIHRHRDGTLFPVEVSSIGADIGGERLLLSIIRDITERKRIEAGQQLLAETGRLLTSTLEVTDRLEALTHLITKDLADWCVITLLAGNGQIQLAAASHRDPAKMALISQFVQHHPQALQAEQTILKSNFLENVPLDQTCNQLLEQLDGHTTIIAPLIARGRALGSITLVRARPERPFDEQELVLAEEVARRTAVAIDNARLYEAERAARIEAETAQQSLALMAEIRERNRLAQELHDNVAQALGYLNLKITVTNELLAANQLEQVEANLSELKQIIVETYGDIRSEIFNLRTAPSNAVNFLETLRQYLDKYKRFYRLDIKLIFEVDEAFFDFSSEMSIALIRIIQEALMNIRKHAQTDHAYIRLGQIAGFWRIQIEDEGRGFDLQQVTGKEVISYGLKIMQERIEAVGGHLEIESTPGQGTRITLLYPKG